MRAGIYARVSTTDRQNPEMQIRELKEFATARKWKIETFVDQISSGKIRPELERMLALCRRRKLDVVIVYRFDRFARSSIELLTALEEFRKLGIDFVSLHESIDTTTAQGKLMFSIIAAFAEFERALIRERVRSGLAQARAEGKRLGRPPRPPADVERIRTMRRQGRSWRAIAGELGIPCSSVRRAVLLIQKPVEGIQ